MDRVIRLRDELRECIRVIDSTLARSHCRSDIENIKLIAKRDNIIMIGKKLSYIIKKYEEGKENELK